MYTEISNMTTSPERIFHTAQTTPLQGQTYFSDIKRQILKGSS